MSELKVYYCSDVHNDYHRKNALETIVGDKDAVLIVAGDINSKGRTVSDLEAVADRWRAVIAVLGNHDWWKLGINDRHVFKSEVDNVHILMEDTVVIDDVTFCGTTLWFPLKNDVDGFYWSDTINDKRSIRGRDKKHSISWQEVNEEYEKAIEFIEDCHDIKGKKVLITHHAPSFKSISPSYAGSKSNMLYCTNIEPLLDQFEYVVHGHVHQCFDYYVNNTNVLCNPRAYGNENMYYDIRSFSI